MNENNNFGDMSELNKALDEQIRIMKGMAKDLKELKQSILSKPTELDILSACQSINRMLQEANYPTLGESTLRQWITGNESFSELQQIVADWIDHVNSRCEGEQ